jgi:hypothetical protein
MSIIEEAEKVKWQETQTKIAETLKEIQYPIQDLAFYEVLRFFDLTTADKLKNPETLKKVETIYQYFKNSEDILADLRELNSKLGNPFDLAERLNKIYSFVYSQNLEKGLQEEKEIQDTRIAEELAKKQAEKEELEKKKEREQKLANLRTLEKEREIEKEKRREKYLREKKEKETQERISTIEKTKPPKMPEVPKIKIC